MSPDDSFADMQMLKQREVLAATFTHKKIVLRGRSPHISPWGYDDGDRIDDVFVEMVEIFDHSIL